MEVRMKWVWRILGALLILMGLVWILQGVNVLGGSMMSGHIQYAILGIVVAAIGIGLEVFANRRPKIPGGTSHS
jgi:hypothetical protein